MRTTITLDDDVAAEVERIRRERSLGVSAAVNELVRRGLARRSEPAPFTQRTSDGGVRLDVTNVGDVLDVVDGPSHR